MKTEERAIAIDKRFITAEKICAIPFEDTQDTDGGRFATVHTVLGIIVKALFLAAWAYGLFQGGILGLFCILCGIIVLAVTTFTK